MTELTPVHEDGTDCTHRQGPPHMAGPHGPALCVAGVRVTHLRVDGQTWELGVAVSAVQQVGQLLVSVFTPWLVQVAGWARALSDNPAFQAACAASGVLAAAAIAEQHHLDPDPPAAAGDPGAGGETLVDPCGNGPAGQLPGQLHLPL